jgi:flagellar biosynthesis protein FliQ
MMESDPDFFMALAQQALWTTALASMPILIPVLVVGLLVGVGQAATSINEATLSFVPKLIVVAVVLALFGGAIMGVMVDFTREMFARIPEITR